MLREEIFPGANAVGGDRRSFRRWLCQHFPDRMDYSRNPEQKAEEEVDDGVFARLGLQINRQRRNEDREDDKNYLIHATQTMGAGPLCNPERPDPADVVRVDLRDGLGTTRAPACRLTRPRGNPPAQKRVIERTLQLLRLRDRPSASLSAPA